MKKLFALFLVSMLAPQAFAKNSCVGNFNTNWKDAPYTLEYILHEDRIPEVGETAKATVILRYKENDIRLSEVATVTQKESPWGHEVVLNVNPGSDYAFTAEIFLEDLSDSSANYGGAKMHFDCSK